MERKVFLLGLDCIPPEFVFEKYSESMPNLSKLLKNGIHGELRSSIPPSSTNAWTSMATSKSADSFGIYDYIYRNNRSYSDLRVINASLMKDDSIWDILSKKGKKVIVINVPLTYPAKEVNGIMITGPLTPSNANFTYPLELENELKNALGEEENFIPYIKDHRKLDEDQLYERLYSLMKSQFSVMRYLITKKEWDFFMSVIYSTDALMHNFWRYIDKDHKKYTDDPEKRDAIRNFLKEVDTEIGKILEMLSENTSIIIMSDHGAKRMDGRININDWLIKEGYLVLKNETKGPVLFHEADIDWSKTKAFSLGAYYSSLFLNVKNRDPEGIVERGGEYNKLIKEISEKIKDIKDENNKNLDTRIHFVNEGNYSPDMIVYFDNLHWGVNSSIGNDGLYSWATERGPDDSIHSMTGFFLMSGEGIQNRGYIGKRDIRDITPSILKIFGFSEDGLEGRPIEGVR